MTSEVVRLQVRFGGVVEGNPPMLAFSKLLTRTDRKRKLHSQMVQVKDSVLLNRLCREVHLGDELEIVLETDWSQENIPTILKEFSLVREPLLVAV